MAKVDFTARPGEYTYSQDAYGKRASGIVKVGATSPRDRNAQRAAGGEERLSDDQGGHLIAHSLGGRNDRTNLDPQNANVNQIGQRNIEESIARLASDPGKTVHMDVQNYTQPGSQRPDATMINVSVLDHETGQVNVYNYSLQNASYAEQAQWDAIAAEDTEIDPRQDIGMTPEERALANEYAGVDCEIPMGEGYTVHFEDGVDDGMDDGMDDGIDM